MPEIKFFATLACFCHSKFRPSDPVFLRNFLNIRGMVLLACVVFFYAVTTCFPPFSPFLEGQSAFSFHISVSCLGTWGPGWEPVPEVDVADEVEETVDHSAGAGNAKQAEVEDEPMYDQEWDIGDG